MSTLRVGNLTAVGGTGTITVPTGNKIAQTGAILQVVQTTKTDTFSTSSTSFTNITGMTLSITPSSTSSKILLMAQIPASMGDGGTTGVTGYFRFSGGNSENFVGDTGGSRIRAVGTVHDQYNYRWQGSISVLNIMMNYLDSPNTTSAITYSVQTRVNSSTVYVNRTGVDSDSSTFGRFPSSLIALEVAG